MAGAHTSKRRTCGTKLLLWGPRSATCGGSDAGSTMEWQALTPKLASPLGPQATSSVQSSPSSPVPQMLKFRSQTCQMMLGLRLVRVD